MYMSSNKYGQQTNINTPLPLKIIAITNALPERLHGEPKKGLRIIAITDALPESPNEEPKKA